MAVMKELRIGNMDDNKVSIFDRPVGWNWFNKTLKTCHRIPNTELSELVVLAKGGCAISKDKVIRSCLRFVVAIAKKHISRNKSQCFDLMDIIQVGCIGVLRAIENYEERDSCSFPSYAIYSIRGQIMASFKLIDLIKRPLPLKNNEAIQVESLSTELEDGELLAENIPDTSMSLTEQEYSIQSFRIDLDRTLNTLTEREKEIIRLFFIGGQSLEDIGYAIGLTRERTRQIKDKAITKLRSKIRACILEDYPYNFDKGNGFKIYDRDANEQAGYVNSIYKPNSAELLKKTTPTVFSTTTNQLDDKNITQTTCSECGKSFTRKFMPHHVNLEHPKKEQPQKKIITIKPTKGNIEQPITQAKPQLTISQKMKQPQLNSPLPPSITYLVRTFLFSKQGTMEALESSAKHNNCQITKIKILLFKKEPDLIQFNEYVNDGFCRVLNVKTDILNIIQKPDFLHWEYKFAVITTLLLTELMERLIIKHGSCKKTEVRVLFYIKKEGQDTPYIQYYKEGDLTGGQYLAWNELKKIFFY